MVHFNVFATAISI